MAAVAVVVYEKVGVSILRRVAGSTWTGLWAIVLIVAGILTLAI